jgi:hypothetical protein
MGDPRERFDVLEVEIKEPHRVRVLGRDRTAESADGFIKFAVARRGVESHFYIKKQAGAYRDGDTLK